MMLNFIFNGIEFHFQLNMKITFKLDESNFLRQIIKVFESEKNPHIFPRNPTFLLGFMGEGRRVPEGAWGTRATWVMSCTSQV